MNIEFNIQEMIDILEKLGYQVKEKDFLNASLRSKYYKSGSEYVVIKDGEEMQVEEAFRKELIYHIFKIK